MTADLRLGRWQSVLADVECDALICDPPYSRKVHQGNRSGANPSDAYGRDQINYAEWCAQDVAEFVGSWAPRTRGWMLALTSSDLIPAWIDAYEDAGRLAFQPLPCVMPGMTCRLTGDGPSSWAVYAMVARPRTHAMARWGTLDGAYFVRQAKGWPTGAAREGGGGRSKSIDLMRALVKDYSRPGDLICDPTAGFGTTGLAALSMGRRFVGAECDEAAHAEAMRRLARPTNGDLLAGLG